MSCCFQLLNAHRFGKSPSSGVSHSRALRTCFLTGPSLSGSRGEGRADSEHFWPEHSANKLFGEMALCDRETSEGSLCSNSSKRNLRSRLWAPLSDCQTLMRSVLLVHYLMARSFLGPKYLPHFLLSTFWKLNAPFWVTWLPLKGKR